MERTASAVGEADSRKKAEILHLEWHPLERLSSRSCPLYSNIESPLNRRAAPYSDRACSFITSRAIAECAIAAPARISAATQMASTISFSVAPF
jgi:hypothetical protein